MSSASTPIITQGNQDWLKQITFPVADTENRYRSTDVEDTVLVSDEPSLMFDLYAINESGDTVYLAVFDRADTAFDTGASGGKFTLYPITAGGYISVANDKGERFANGIVVCPYADIACTVSASGSLKYNIGWEHNA